MRTLLQQFRRLGEAGELIAMVAVLAASILVFGAIAPGFYAGPVFSSMAFQLPELGLLALAMFVPIISGGLNLSVTYSANISGLLAAFFVKAFLVNAGWVSLPVALAIGLGSGLAIGFAIGIIVAYVGAHPILVSLGMMILLRGLGEWATRGGDISGMPDVFATIGYGTVLGVPVPMIVFLAAVAATAYLMGRTKEGFAIYMVGSTPAAAEYSGIDVRKTLVLVYSVSGLLTGLAGVLMLARFNSVRVGHGDSYLLITILACFLAGANPFGGFGKVLPLAVALMSLQVIASGMNLMGASQHLSTAAWGAFLILVMAIRAPFLRQNK
ncbi:ABC transporter permease [Rhodobium gokarnense]|uniref:Simple sugar transport system permease protein n=1 Tax=Rhodobium gokarnense TaxID=364296 RepID=A0ABT3HAH5_9HYPH|nr:ABC transporter permease [Rhodobium gokarnense]MCW2307354.1 simple sugar transport system permease protein [Rhodobium gokarnense]